MIYKVLVVLSFILAFVQYYFYAREKLFLKKYYFLVFWAVLLGAWAAVITSGIEGFLVSSMQFTDYVATVKLGRRWSGGLLFVFLFIAFFQQKVKPYYQKIQMLEVLIVCSLLPLALGKIGCFLGVHLECYGKHLNLPWSSIIEPYSTELSKYIHPIPLYDSLLAVILFVLFVFLKIKPNYNHGTILSIFIVVLSFYNFFIEFLKNTSFVFLSLSVNQVVYIVLFLSWIFFCLKGRSKGIDE